MLYRPIPQQAFRAELVGSNRCTTAGFTASGQANMLALRVRSIGEAARFAVEDNKTGRPTFRHWRDRPARDGAAPPIAPIALQVV
jgi:hypothetical protein